MEDGITRLKDGIRCHEDDITRIKDGIRCHEDDIRILDAIVIVTTRHNGSNIACSQDTSLF